MQDDFLEDLEDQDDSDLSENDLLETSDELGNKLYEQYRFVADPGQTLLV